MKKFVKIFVILGIVLSLCGGIVTAAGYIGGGFRELTGKVSGKVSSNIPAVQSAKAQESLTFSPNEIGRLEFRLNSENIAFHPSDDGQIHIRGMTSPTRPTRSRAPVQMVLAPWFSPEKTLPPAPSCSTSAWKLTRIARMFR